ncbi:uncharacterized protein BDR25DRAFT_267094 [Lindgomyces ingoldianus]|uniref:Uncharacterized protein n=1 Tax=Lindgomyces ingoldianus TaxID=673940 RepID=A0ACB6QKT4_9PLEO|nr:uncharacterized protein BDR25DRAFT_267094 [Lindgomyces ingoldianus]KAF2467574.1 hypothetical protein BDR25DRAFT_267094 [Lindgomyces ingoldianus]
MASSEPPTLKLNGSAEPTTMDTQPSVENFGQFKEAQTERPRPARAADSNFSKLSTTSVPPEGSILTGKQEHYLKRELVSQQTKFEIAELSSPTALQRFGAPFRSDAGEVAPEDSELPILRYIFVHNVRNFPFLDKAKEKEFWQDKLQTFLESFANKHVSSSEDRLEETKRKKLALKAEKLVELMMVSGIPTASGYEERIRFSEMEIVERGANENGLAINAPSGHSINGWDVNVAGVRTMSVKKHVRYHTHAEYLIRVKQSEKEDFYVGRRYADFVHLHKRIRLELPGKVLPPLPRKNKKDSLLQPLPTADDDDISISSVSTQEPAPDPYENGGAGGLRSYIFSNHKQNSSATSLARGRSPRASNDNIAYREPRVLYREEQRVSLRAFLRTFLQNEVIAQSSAMVEFLTGNPIELNEEEMEDIERRKEMDEKRVEEQKQFYEIARQRAAELDIHMERFRREIVEANGLSHLFQEIRVKNTIAELKPEYQKFAEWLRIEVAATIYHLFLAEDNSPELFAQAKRIHSLVPYTVLKNVIRIANPAAVMSGVLDLFLAQPFGARSLLQRMFGMAINDGVRQVQKSIDTLASTKIKDDVLCAKIKAFVDSDEDIKEMVRMEAAEESVDVVVTILRSEYFEPELTPAQVEKVFNAFVAWNNAVENVRGGHLSRKSSSYSSYSISTNGSVQMVDEELRQGAELFAHLKQYLKLCLRQRDKVMMLQIIEEPTTLQLFRDLFTIFYEPLVRVYKSANVYNSITDFALFVDDTIRVVEACQRQDVSADPNQTVQAFIDLCARHEDNFYKFVHEVHIHDNGLFDQLMGWLEGILEFLRHGPRGGGKLDMNALFQGGMDSGVIDKKKAIREINSLIRWQTARKKWHQDKTRQKMASGGGDDHADMLGGMGGFKTSDFGLNELDLQDLELDDDGSYDESDSEFDDDDIADPIQAERKRRARAQEKLRRTAGEPKKPDIEELTKLHPTFLSMLRSVLAE